jgi:EAL domain-containing protein (putative c-di-GMP-specific phosphodiesterase class I)
VRAVIGLSHALNIPIIAEGVETDSERDFLREEGCREIQGYPIGRPQPIANCADLTSDFTERLFGRGMAAADLARRRVSTDGP